MHMETEGLLMTASVSISLILIVNCQFGKEEACRHAVSSN